ncbi:MAG: flavin reductase family protein [Gemmatimonadales bacterium]|nr:flavin reductase family protein [Gemmatimonadales bacterium]
MNPDETYELLRNLTSPVVAITSRRGEKSNGMISDAAIRASIVPDIPRLAVFIHKFNLSHALIFETGAFALHILHQEQIDLVIKLGFVSGRDRDKLADVPHRLGALGCPILEDCYAWFDCRVINIMDTGSSTCFLGEAEGVGRGPGREVMESAYLRAKMPEEWKNAYLQNLGTAQAAARAASRNIRALHWKGLPR